MDLVNILTGAGLLGSGGFLGWIGKLYLDKSRLDSEVQHTNLSFIQDQFQLALKVVTDQRDNALEEKKELLSRLDNLELEIVGLKLSNNFDPFPRWMVDLQGKFLYVNPCFEERYLYTREPPIHRRDLIGKGHDIIWPKEFFDKLHELDKAAKTRPDGRARAHMVINGDDVTVYKFPVRIHGIIVAYAGYILYMD
jgi:PAS domain-containing protein